MADLPNIHNWAMARGGGGPIDGENDACNTQYYGLELVGRAAFVSP
jgi:hypothetical protein